MCSARACKALYSGSIPLAASKVGYSGWGWARPSWSGASDGPHDRKRTRKAGGHAGCGVPRLLDGATTSVASTHAAPAPAVRGRDATPVSFGAQSCSSQVAQSCSSQEGAASSMNLLTASALSKMSQSSSSPARTRARDTFWRAITVRRRSEGSVADG